jgi:hypothetical protein
MADEDPGHNRSGWRAEGIDVWMVVPAHHYVSRSPLPLTIAAENAACRSVAASQKAGR